MKSSSSPLLLMHPDPVFRARVSDAAKPDFNVVVAASWDALRDGIQHLPPAAVVVDPYEGLSGGGELSPELQRLLEDFSSVVVVAAMRFQPARIADVRTLGEWGIAEVISDGDDNVAAIGMVLRSVRGRALKRFMAQAVPRMVSARARTILKAAAEVTADGGKATEMARRLFVSMRTLHRWCDVERLPPPRQLLAWMRILLASTLLDDRGRSVEDIAWACGYSADSGLRRALREFLGISPKALRSGSAVDTVFGAFSQALSTAMAGSMN